jgi:hypothetical protein
LISPERASPSGEHLDRDLREWLDDGCPTDPYQFSAYHLDVDDWSILDRIKAEQLWRIDDDLFARIQLDLGGLYWGGAEHQLPVGTSLWILGFKYHQMAVHCVVKEPDDLEYRIVPESLLSLPRYRGYEVIVPVAAFSRMHLEVPH